VIYSTGPDQYFTSVTLFITLSTGKRVTNLGEGLPVFCFDFSNDLQKSFFSFKSICRHYTTAMGHLDHWALWLLIQALAGHSLSRAVNSSPRNVPQHIEDGGGELSPRSILGGVDDVASLRHYKNRLGIAHLAANEHNAMHTCTCSTCFILARWCNIIYSLKAPWS
jgi:hypothetical protein